MAPKLKTIKLKPGETKEVTLNGVAGMFQVSTQVLNGSQRSDLGAPFSLARPQGYRERVEQMWMSYDTDNGFKYMIDRISHYGCNGFTFFTTAPDELDFWEEWSERINTGIQDTIPGLKEIIKWNIKHLSLGGMAMNNWKWGKMRIGKADYEVPIEWTLHNHRSITMTRGPKGFKDTKIGIRVPHNQLHEGDTGWKKAYNVERLENGDDYILPLTDTYFLLKFNSTPEDNTKTDNAPMAEQAAFSLYPTPPYMNLLSVIKERQQLRSMDLNIVDGFINKLVIWKVGNKEFPPKPEHRAKDGTVTKSTIDEVKAIITADTKGNVMQIFVPYWIEVDIKTPDIAPLINPDKYMQAWIEMLWSFGIFVTKDSSGAQFVDMNTQNFEQLVDFYREEHVKEMLEHVVFAEIARRNGLKKPAIRYNPLNTLKDEFLRNIREIAGLGRLSTPTLLKYHKQDAKYEMPLIQQDLDNKQFKGEFAGMSPVDIYNEATPIRFKQTVDNGQAPSNSGKSKTKISSTPVGRPAGKKDQSKRKVTR